jgi:putative RNA 2'-phosphotransferase
LIAEIVATSDKQRFALDHGTNRIRANQGHSVEIDLGLQPDEPPAILFHWHGRHDGARHPLRAAQTRAIASTCTSRPTRRPPSRSARRHGRPVVLRVFAGKMWGQGSLFFRSANGVWLTPAVPPEFIEFRDRTSLRRTPCALPC